MAKQYGDIGKGVKDILAEGKYEHKASLATKTAGGMGVSCSGTKKGDGVALEGKLDYKISKLLSVESTLTSGGKLSVKTKFDDIAPGLKANLNTPVPDVAASKLGLDYYSSPVGLKCELGVGSAPKVDASGCVNLGSAAVGAEVGFDSAKNAVTKYGVAATYYGGDYTLVGSLVDKMDTVKLGYVQTVNPTLTVGGELVRKLAAGTTSFALGAAKKLEGGASAGATINSAGLLSVKYAAPLKQPGASLTAAAQFNTINMDSAKAGVAFAFKA